MLIDYSCARTYAHWHEADGIGGHAEDCVRRKGLQEEGGQERRRTLMEGGGSGRHADMRYSRIIHESCVCARQIALYMKNMMHHSANLHSRGSWEIAVGRRTPGLMRMLRMACTYLM